MRAYMNNLSGRKHAQIYGDGAFFDLDLTGRQATMLRGIAPNTVCLVATYADRAHSKVTISTYLLEREANCPSETPGEICRVFFGAKQREITLPRSEAPDHAEFAPFFNRERNFLRGSARLWPPAK